MLDAPTTAEAPDSGSPKQRQTRDRLLVAARAIFLKIGYKGTTLDDVAKAAGFTKGAVYWHFPNKRALFLALVAKSVADNMVVIDGFLKIGATDPAAMKAKLGEWIDGIDERESLPAFGADLEIESRHDAEFRAIHQGMISEHEAQLGAFLEHYFALVGETPSLPPLELGQALITIFKGFALCRQNRPINPPNSARMVRLLMGMPTAAHGPDGTA